MGIEVRYYVFASDDSIIYECTSFDTVKNFLNRPSHKEVCREHALQVIAFYGLFDTAWFTDALGYKYRVWEQRNGVAL